MYYDEIADGYDLLHGAEQERKIALIQTLIRPLPGESLLDVGCGSGISTRPWKCHKKGIDPSEKLIGIARSKDADGQYLVAGAESIPFTDNRFDYVISVSSIHNFSDPMKGLSEIRRVGKSNYVFSVLKSANSFSILSGMIKELFSVEMVVRDAQDVVFLAKE